MQAGLGKGLAYLRVGTGRPVLYLPGLTMNHRPPKHLARRMQVGQIKPFAADRQVWWVQRPQDLPAGTAMADIASAYAEALRSSSLDLPVDVVGTSTGGSVALQLAADHPGVVRRLAMMSSACRLGPTGRAGQRRVAVLLTAGRVRAGSALFMSLAATGPAAQRTAAATGWLLGESMTRHGTADLVATIEAEDDFDLTARLSEITTPTLVVGGGRDRFYGEQLFRETASGLPNGSLFFHPDKGHVGAQTSRTAIREVLRFLAEP